jgi:hypothetical protein
MKESARTVRDAQVAAPSAASRPLGKPLVVAGSITALVATLLPVVTLPGVGRVSMWGWPTDAIRNHAILISLCAAVAFLAAIGVIQRGLVAIAGVAATVTVLAGIEVSSSISGVVAQCKVQAAGNSAAIATCDSVQGYVLWVLGAAVVLLVAGALMSGREQHAA